MPSDLAAVVCSSSKKSKPEAQSTSCQRHPSASVWPRTLVALLSQVRLFAQMGIAAHSFRLFLLEGIHHLACFWYMKIDRWKFKNKELRRSLILLSLTRAELTCECDFFLIMATYSPSNTYSEVHHPV